MLSRTETGNKSARGKAVEETGLEVQETRVLFQLWRTGPCVGHFTEVTEVLRPGNPGSVTRKAGRTCAQSWRGAERRGVEALAESHRDTGMSSSSTYWLDDLEQVDTVSEPQLSLL